MSVNFSQVTPILFLSLAFQDMGYCKLPFQCQPAGAMQHRYFIEWTGPRNGSGFEGC